MEADAIADLQVVDYVFDPAIQQGEMACRSSKEVSF